MMIVLDATNLMQQAREGGTEREREGLLPTARDAHAAWCSRGQLEAPSDRPPRLVFPSFLRLADSK